MKQYPLRLPEELYRAIRIRAALRDMNVREYMVDVLGKAVSEVVITEPVPEVEA